MKKLIIIIVFFAFGFSGFGQKQRVNYMTTFDEKLIHFGFTLGLNTLDMGFTHYNQLRDNPDFVLPGENTWLAGERRITGVDDVRADISELIPGFTVGIVTSLRVRRDLNLRFLPGLSFGERRFSYNVDVVDNEFYGSRKYYSIKSTYLDFPLLFKYKARRINNDRPYIILGGAYRHDISRTGKEDLVQLKDGGYYAEMGVGWDHYFTFFRFSIEAKVSIGLNNQLGDDPATNQRQYYSQAIKYLRPQVFTLCFHFE